MADPDNTIPPVSTESAEINSPQSTKTKKAPQNVKSKRRQKKRKLPMADQLHEDVCRVLRNCDEGTELKALTYALQPESEFMECIFEKIVYDIKNVLSQRFRNFEIHPFGSSVCGMAFKSEFKKYPFFFANVLVNTIALVGILCRQNHPSLSFASCCGHDLIST